jgi:hypothetical protein
MFFSKKTPASSFCTALLSIALTLGLTVVGLLSIPHRASADITTGLVGHWTFDNTTDDESGQGNHGTFNGGSPTYQTGKVGQALYFDGTDDCVAIPNSSLWDFAGKDATVSVWMRADASGSGADNIVEHFDGGTPGDGWTFQISSANQALFSHRGTERLSVNDNSRNWRDEQWHHWVGVVRDATADAGEFYIDGVLVGTDTFSGLIDNNQDLGIGANQNCASGNFPGLIDDVRIYNRALSQTDITELYNYTGADTEDPTVSITAPADNDTVADTVTFSANASDNVGVTQVEFFVDGASKGTDTSSPYSINWDTTNGGTHACMGAHTHTLTAIARDQAGNQKTSSPITVYMNDPSYCSSSLPTYTVVKTGTAPVIDGNLSEYASANTITMSGGNGNTTNVKMLWDSANLYIGAITTDTELNAAVTTHDTSGVWNDDGLEFVFDTQNNGGWDTSDYKIIVNAQGATYDARNFTDLTWNGPYQKAVTRNGTLNDGVNDTSYTIELAIPWTSVNVTPSTATTYGMNFQTNDADATRTTYTWNGAINTVADAGNVTLSNTLVDPGTTDDPPTVSISSPSNGATVSNTITVSANASDDNGVSKVEFFRNNTLIGTDTSSPYSISWNTTTVSNADYILTARATDSTGQTTTSSGISVTVSNTVAESGLAFPTAEGFGRFAKGGRGGYVCHVNSTSNGTSGSQISGTPHHQGTLRYCLGLTGARSIVFDVAGTIDYNETQVQVLNPFATIAGQTAPGDGILIKRGLFRVRGANDVIVRHLRVRPGVAGTDTDSVAYSFQGLVVSHGANNVIVDHCSVSWVPDDTWSSYQSTNVTYQWCINAEGLRLKTIRPSDGTSYTTRGKMMWIGSTNNDRTSILHNLVAHQADRVPNAYKKTVQFNNNLVYNSAPSRMRPNQGEPLIIEFVENY